MVLILKSNSCVVKESDLLVLLHATLCFDVLAFSVPGGDSELPMADAFGALARLSRFFLSTARNVGAISSSGSPPLKE